MTCLALTAAQAAPPEDAGSIASYALTSGSESFTPLTGSTRLAGIEANDASSEAVPLGFTFWYLGVPYSQVWANSNGFLSFNRAAPASSTTNMRTNALASGTSTLRPLAAPLWDDLSGAASGRASYLTAGDPGTRIFTFEWLNWKWSSAATSSVISFQVRLHEADGRIEFLYRQEGGAVTSGSASIGLAATGTGSGSFLSLQSTGASPVASTTTEAASLPIKPATDQIYTFTPPATVPDAPAGLVFSGVSGTSMNLSWTDLAVNEAGYTILRSTDAVNYVLAATTAANAVSYAAGGLALGTTYHWRVHAVTEGRASAPLAGSQATTPAGEVACAGSGGLWSVGDTWSGGVVPASTDNVTITDGCTVTLNAAAVVNHLTVGQGVSGVLQFEAATARTMTVNAGLAIAPGGTLQSAATGSVTGHLLQVAGSLTNDGTLDLSTNGNAAGTELRFTGAAPAAFSGGGVTDLRTLSLSKGDIGNVLEVTVTFSVRGAASTDTVGFFALPHVGTLKLSGTASYTSPLFTTASWSIPSSGGLWLNNPNFTVSGQAASAVLTGHLRVSAGQLTIGAASGHSLGFSSLSRVTIEGGAVQVAGRFGVSSAGLSMTYVQTGGTVTVATAGNTSTSLASFDLGTSNGTSFSMSGGTIVVRLANSAASGPRDYRAGVGTSLLTGGTLQFGDAASGGARSFTMAAVSSTIPTVFPHLVITNVPAAHSLQYVTGPVAGLGATIQSGATLTMGAFPLLLAGDLINDGTLTGTLSGARLHFAGTHQAQSWSGTGSVTTPLDGLIIENAAGVTLASTPFSTLRVNLLRGTLTNSSQITLGNGGATSAITQIGSPGQSSPGGSFDSDPSFNAGSGGVQVLYLQESTARVTGPEIPSSRSVAALNIANTNGVILAGGGLAVSSAFTLTVGLLHTTDTDLPTLGSAVTPPSGSASSYVDGPLAIQVQSAGNITSLTFPVGTGTGWRPVVLGSFHTGGVLRAYTAQVFDGPTGGFPDPPLTSLNPVRYLRLQNTSGLFSSTVATVQLSYGAGDVVPSLATARIAQSGALSGTYTSRGGGSATLPTTGIASDTPIQPGDEYFVIADGTPAGPPVNDDCAAAIPVPSAGPFPHLTGTIDVATATTTGDPAFCSTASHTAWYTFTPDVTATYRVSSCHIAAPGTTATDTVLGIFTASSCDGPFTTVACNDNDASCSGGSGRSSASVILTAGTAYYIVVGTAGTGTPSPAKIQLSIAQSLPPTNDSCAAPVALTLDSPVAGTTKEALNDYQLSGTSCFTSQGQLGNFPSTAPGRDVVYSFTAPAAGKYSIRVSGYTAADAVLYTAGSCPVSTYPTPEVVSSCVSAADRTSAPAEEVMCQSLSAGQTVYVMVDEFVAGGSDFTIEATSCDQEAGSNNTPAGANTMSCGKEGSIALSDRDYFSLGAPAAGWRAFTMMDALASATADTHMRITDAANVWEFDDDDGAVPFGAGGLASLLSGTVLPGGPVFVSVAALDNNTVVEPYRVYSVVQPPLSSAASESEPNETPGEADAGATGWVRGMVSTSSDTDLFAFQAAAGDMVFLGLDCDADRDGTAVNGTLSLLSHDGSTVLVSVNGSSSFQVPAPLPGIGLTATTPAFAGEGLVHRVNATGTYFARVTGVPGGSPASQDYALSISRNCTIPPADLAVSQTASIEPVPAGSDITYTVALTNIGPNNALNVRLTAGVPAHTMLVSVIPPAGWSCAPPSEGQHVCSAASLAPSAPAVFSITYRAGYCTGNVGIEHTVSVASDIPDSAPANDGSTLAGTLIDSGACSDGNVCTVGDTCIAGVCLGGPPPDCSDESACTADSCHPVTGLCVHAPLDCDDGNACTDDGCDVSLGCVSVNDDTNACSDDDLCTQDQCQTGSCVGTPVICSDENACTDDSCDPSTGGCLYENNTDPCDDGDLCTTDDQCGPLKSEDFDMATPPALPIGWSTQLLIGLSGNLSFVTDAAYSDTPPQSAFTDAPDHVTDKVLTSPAISISSPTARLVFRHRYDLEDLFDGAVLEIAVGAGGFMDIETAGGSFVAGGYDAVITTGEGSPIGGRSAWTGASGGFEDVTVDLPMAAAGHPIVLRWRVATDSINGASGYWVDSIALTDPGDTFTCTGATLSCDDANTCTVDGCDPQSGCLNTPGNPGTVCRPSSGLECDTAEMCDGVSDTCPPDTFGQSTAVGNTVLLTYTILTGTATISWSGEMVGGPFNVYKGSLTQTGFPAVNHLCLMASLITTSFDDAGVLPPGALSYYLVSRSTPPCLESSLGLWSDGTERPNINPCP